MIQTIEGRLGGGKTYTAIIWICNHLAKGGVVATNINIMLDKFTDKYGEKRGLRWLLREHYGYVLKDSQIIRLSDTATVPYKTNKGVFHLLEIVMFYKIIPRGTPKQPVLVVVDEAHIHFPQDGFRSIPKEVLHFLTLSRHNCVDVVFISQHIKNMWCQMLRLAQFRWVIRDMKQYGFPLGALNIPWPFPHYLRCKNDYDGKTIIARQFEWAKKRYYECYKSPEMAAGFESMEVAASVEIERVELTMSQKFKLAGMAFLMGVMVSMVPACMMHKESSSTEDLESPADSVIGVVSAPSSGGSIADPGLVEENPEYYLGHLDSGWDSKFYTTKKTYAIGDMYEGFPIVLVRANELVTFNTETGEYKTHWFDSKPRDQDHDIVSGS